MHDETTELEWEIEVAGNSFAPMIHIGHYGRLNTFAAAKVLCVLAGHRNRNTGQCYPSEGTIAYKARLSRRSVRRALDELRNAGMLRWTNHGVKGRMYEFLIDPQVFQPREIRTRAP